MSSYLPSVARSRLAIIPHAPTSPYPHHAPPHPHLGAGGQTPTLDLVRHAVTVADEANASQTRFTCFDLEHLQNRNQKGKLFVDRQALYEDTWIADLPYKRLVEVDGKPLAGTDLTKEQARYDQAIAERKGLGPEARAKLLHIQSIDAAVHLADLLTPVYRLTELQQESLDGQTVHVIEAVTPGRRFQLWITASAPTLLRFTLDVSADEPTMLQGSRLEKDFLLIDSTPVSRHSLAHVLYPNKGKPITLDVEHTYTRYRRFSATARILPD